MMLLNWLEVAVMVCVQFVVSLEVEITPELPTPKKVPLVKMMLLSACAPNWGFPFGSGLRQCQLSRGPAERLPQQASHPAKTAPKKFFVFINTISESKVADVNHHNNR